MFSYWTYFNEGSRCPPLDEDIQVSLDRELVARVEFFPMEFFFNSSSYRFLFVIYTCFMIILAILGLR